MLKNIIILIVITIAVCISGEDNCEEPVEIETNENDNLSEEQRNTNEEKENNLVKDNRIENIASLFMPSTKDKAQDKTPLTNIEHEIPVDDTLDSSLLDVNKAVQEVNKDIDQTITNIQTVIDDAEKAWKEWAKNYNCLNNLDFVQCMTRTKIVKSPFQWKKQSSQVEIPIKAPVRPNVEKMNMKIENSLKEFLQNWYKIISKSNNIKEHDEYFK